MDIPVSSSAHFTERVWLLNTAFFCPSEPSTVKGIKAVWLSDNTLADCATVGGSNLNQCSKNCKVLKPGSQHWKSVNLPWLGYHVKPLVPCIGRVIPKHVKDPSTFIEKSRVQYPTMLVRYHTKTGWTPNGQCLRLVPLVRLHPSYTAHVVMAINLS